MRKNVFGRQLKRDKNERAALFKGLISSLVIHERIKTTEEKAKAIKADADKIITIAKKGEAMAINLLQGKLPKSEIEKVIFEIAPRFNGRQGGYTRIIRIGRRFSDNAQMVFLEWTVQSEVKSSKLKVQSLDKKAAVTEIQKESESQKKTQKKREEVETKARKKVLKK